MIHPPGFAFLLGTALFGLLLGAAASLVEDRWPSPHRFGRKLVHAGVFSGAAWVHLSTGFWGVVVYGTVLTGLLTASGLVWRSAGPLGAIRGGQEPTTLKEDVGFPFAATVLGGVVGSLLVGELVVIGYLCCAFGDPAGAWVGREMGRRRLSVPFRQRLPSVKTLEGNLAVLGGAWLGAVLAVYAVSGSLWTAIWVGAACGLVGAFAEGVSGSGSDNFWLQVLPSLTGWWILG